MTRLKVVIIAAAAIGVAVLWMVQHQTQVRLREENVSLQQRMEKLDQVMADNERLSNLVARANTHLADAQLKDLLQLRGEVGLLRRQTNELQRLQEQNQQLRSALAVSQNPPNSKTLPDVPPQDIHPKESWTFAGYATPDATIESMAWAVNNGDFKTFIASLAPEMQKEIEKELATKSETDFLGEGKQEVDKFSGFRILQRDIHSDSEVVMDISMDGDNHSDKLLFKKIDGQWRFAGPAGQ